VFGFEVVSACPNVPDEILWPRDTWTDKSAFDAAARKLAGLFVENFKTYEAGASAETRGAGPKP
jgi:phosphoenolpyruvate carboxykinase (ATP)